MADVLVKALNYKGYQAVFLPSTDVLPPELYNVEKEPSPRLVRRGALTRYLPEGTKLDIVNGKRADIEGNYTSEKGAEASISFLQKALACIGISTIPKLDLSFTGSKGLIFAFLGVTSKSVEPAQIDQVVGRIDLGAIPRGYAELGALHIAYEYLYASTLIVERSDRGKFAADISGSVGEFVDVGVGAHVEVTKGERISFRRQEGEPDAPAFAYKAGRLAPGEDGWEFFPEQVKLSPSGRSLKPYVPLLGVALDVTDGVAN